MESVETLKKRFEEELQIFKQLEKDREKAIEIMFETFQVPSMYMALHPTLSLFCHGRKTGLVVDIGADVTHVVPIKEGLAISHAIQTTEWGGNELNSIFERAIAQQSYLHLGPTVLGIILDIKEKFCFVSVDYEADMKTVKSNTSLHQHYQLPDGNSITIGSERFQCAEALFNPALCELPGVGIHQSMFDSVVQCPDIIDELCANVVLTGGSTLFPGFLERLQKELLTLSPTTKVNFLPTSKYTTWLGGSKFACQPNFNQMSISKEDYQKFGTAIVHSKCKNYVN